MAKIDLRECLNAISDVVNNRPTPLREFDQIYMKSADMLLQVDHISRHFDGKKVIFIGYADATAYIPDDRYISEGGYEVDGSVVEYCLKGRFKSGMDRKMIDAFQANLREL